ncbi:MAG TPA: hypothetical protein VGH28_24645 [Polyangiaceae bacterium]|jgi:hypothetical protein
MTNRRSGLHWVRVVCFVMVTLPNCTRCCPAGFGSCNCSWAWEDCPANGGCDSCGGSSGSAETPGAFGFEAGSQSMSAAATTDDDRGGTLAFVNADSKTFLVVSLGSQNEVRTYRLEANALDDDPLTVRPAGLFPFDGDKPGRVVADGRGHAIVALRDIGAIVTIDPLLATATAPRAVCRDPNALAARGDVTRVACGSGELVSMRDGTELARVHLDGELGEVATSGDGVIAAAGTKLFAVDPDGGVTQRDSSGIVGALRASDGDVRAAFDGDIGTLAADGFHPRAHAAASVTDLFVHGDATAFVADDEAWLRASADADAIPVAEGLVARAVALADVGGEVTRRVLVLRTVKPSMLVFFTVPGIPSAAAIEPLE